MNPVMKCRIPSFSFIIFPVAYIGVDILLYQEIPDLVEAVTRKGDHNIDRPCMACLDGWYVSGNVDEEKMSEMESMRLNDRNGE